MWPFESMSLAEASSVATAGNFALLICLVGGVLATFVIVQSTDRKEEIWSEQRRNSDERIAVSNAKAEASASEAILARNEAKIIDLNLLEEQRLTSNERWRLEHLERIVLPRAAFIDWEKLANKLAGIDFEPIVVAVTAWPHEARDFGTQIYMALSKAGKAKRLLMIPHSANLFAPISSGGVILLAANADADALQTMLWHEFQIGGGSIARGELPPEWDAIPRDQNCLLITENGQALAPMSGQDGEGLDERGRPVPPH